MQVLVFGATGSVGRLVVSQALEQGHEVTAFTRSLERVPTAHPRLTMAIGDVLQPSAVAPALQGHSAVICCLGAGTQGGVRAPGTANIVAAMQHTGVRRLVCQSTLGIGESRGNLNFFWKHLMFGGLLRAVHRDHDLQEQYVRRSGLDWIIARPAAFTDGPRTGAYRHGFAPDDRSTRLKIARADVADFLLKQLTDDQYLHQAPGLSY
jgi:uncharacterized protein YbjT (DUF2867 family)